MLQAEFTPKYQFRAFLFILFYILVGILLFIQIIPDPEKDANDVLLAAFLLIFILRNIYDIIFRITFDDDKLTVHRILGIKQEIPNAEVVGMDMDVIYTKRKNISIRHIENTDTLSALMERYFGKNSDLSSIKSKNPINPVIVLNILFYSAVISYIIFGITLKYWPYTENFFSQIRFLVICLPVSVILYSIYIKIIR